MIALMNKTSPHLNKRGLLCASLVQTRWGFLAIAFEGSSVIALELPDTDKKIVRQRLTSRCGPLTWVEKPFPEVADLLVRYFKGEPVSFDKIRVAPPDGTPFYREVWKRLQAIPYGELVTYGQLAAMLGRPRAARAIGGAVGANPIPLVIPCHRVIQNGGKLGGFSAPGGTSYKKRLLQLEDHHLKGDRRLAPVGR